jgi:hypothetical protein
MTGTVCDGCGKVETDRDELDLRWLRVGSSSSSMFDACSIMCVRVVLRRQIAPVMLRMDLV